MEGLFDQVGAGQEFNFRVQILFLHRQIEPGRRAMLFALNPGRDQQLGPVLLDQNFGAGRKERRADHQRDDEQQENPSGAVGEYAPAAEEHFDPGLQVVIHANATLVPQRIGR